MRATPMGELRARAADEGADRVLGGVARALARELGRDVALVDPGLGEGLEVDLPAGLPLEPESLGVVHEQLRRHTDRRRRGAHYTPVDVARALVAVAQGSSRFDPVPVCDPACGGGVFLLAAGRAMAVDGPGRRRVVEQMVAGTDIDPLAVAVTRTALALWAGTPVGEGRVVVADGLLDPPPWPERFPLVIGNPPFLTPLAAATTPDPERRRRLRARFGTEHGPYVDAAALFAVAALDLLSDLGTLALVQPLSVIAARDAAATRDRLFAELTLRALWVATDRPFEAAVEVCAPVWQRGVGPAPVRLHRDRSFEPVTRPVGPVADLVTPAAAALAMPTVADGLDARPVLGDLVTTTAGFRDEFYAVAAATVEGGDGPEVVTSGRIEPFRLDTTRPARIRGRDFAAPRVDLDRLAADAPRVAGWVRDLLVPKILLATQTRVIEVVVDADGSLVPLTPVLAVVPPVDRLWEVAALLSAPSVSLLAAIRSLGTGRHHGVIKLAARQIPELPGAGDFSDWQQAAVEAQRCVADGGSETSLDRVARAAERALGVEDSVGLDWWHRRRS